MAFAFCMHGIRTKLSECIFSVNQASPFYFTTKYMVLQHFDVFMTKTILTWPVTFVVDKLLWKYMKSMTVSLKFIYWKILFRFVNKRFIIFVLIKHLFILTYVFFQKLWSCVCFITVIISWSFGCLSVAEANVIYGVFNQSGSFIRLRVNKLFQFNLSMDKGNYI